MEDSPNLEYFFKKYMKTKRVCKTIIAHKNLELNYA